MKSTTAILMCVIFSGSGTAWGAQCRVSRDVKTSAASVEANTGAGGHVSIHIKGEVTETEKTLFASKSDFVKAFNAWKDSKAKSPDPKVCGGASAGVMDCVSAAAVGITKGSVCKKVYAKDEGKHKKGECETEKSIKPVKVAFRYAKSGGKWILNTAYPSEKDKCN